MTTFLEELAWRGLIYQKAGAGLEQHLSTPGRVGYCGLDPTADSLHIGNLLPITLLMRWQRAGHKPLVLMGGGTGLIGDPSGRDSERQFLDEEQVRENVEGQRRIYERLLDLDEKNPVGAELVNNLDWLKELSFIAVLRDVGKHFSVNAMVQKESVKTRLETRDQGISYTEFSYMILQAYDFLHLNKVRGCTVQLAGSDQYGNIVAGMDLIRRVRGPEDGKAYGITAPLVTRADGKKFGKSVDGAVWLTADRTSPYRFYQFLINTDDADVGKLLRWYTFLSKEEVEAVEQEQEQAPHLRPAQKALARAVTGLVHGEDEVGRVEQASRVLFGKGNLRDLDKQMLQDVFADVPNSKLDRMRLAAGVDLVDMLVDAELASSKREARQFIKTGSISVNGDKVAPGRTITLEDLLHDETILLRRGKKKWHAASSPAPLPHTKVP